MGVNKVQFHFLQQNISVDLYIIQMMKPFSLQLGEADPAVKFSTLNLNIANGYHYNNLIGGAKLRVTCNLCFFWLRLYQDQITYADPQALGRTNRLSAAKKS